MRPAPCRSRPAANRPASQSAPKGPLWIVERGANSIARLNSDNTVTPLALPNPGSRPNAIVLGPDGNLWFTEEGAPRIGRITASGQITEFTVPGTDGAQLISNGPDGDLRYTQGNEINSISTNGKTGAPGCINAQCMQPIDAIAPGPAGELTYPTGIVFPSGRRGHC